MEVFRDETGLATNPGLWNSIAMALGDSRWFVLLASPPAANSPWVQRELEHWLHTNGVDRVLVVVTDGEWRWDDLRNDFTDDSTSVPPVLRGLFAAEPRHLDMRWARTTSDLDRQRLALRSAIADLAAPIHGIPKDELEGEDVRQHRRTIRAVRFAVSILTLLLVVSVVSAVAAFVQRDQARDEARLADAHRLSALAVSSTDSDLSRALLLAIEGQRLANDAQTRGALLTVVQSAQEVKRIIHGSWKAAAITQDGSAVFVIGGATISRVDLATGRVLKLPDPAPPDARCLDVSPDNTMLAVGGERSVYVLDAKTGARLGPTLSTENLNTFDPVADIQFSPDGAMLAEIDEDGRGTVWATWDRQVIGHFVNGASTDSQPEVDFSPDSDTLATTGDPGLVYDARTVSPLYQQEILGNSQDVDEAIRFSPDGGLVAVAGENGISFRDPGDGDSVGPLIPRADGAPVVKLAYSSDGTVLAGGRADGSVELWDGTSGVTLQAPLVGASRAPLGLSFTSDDHHIVEVTSREIVMFDTSGRFARVLAPDADGASESGINAVTVGPDQKLLAAADSSGAVTLRNISSGGRRIRITTDDAGSGVRAAVFVNSATLAIAGDDGQVSFWNANNGHQEGSPITLTQPALANVSTVGVGIGALANDKSDDALFAFTGAGTIANIDPVHRRLRNEVTVEARQATPISMVIRNDGAQIAISGPTGVELLDGRGRPRLTLAVGAVDSLAYSPNGGELAVGLSDGRLLLIDPSRPSAETAPLVSNHGGVLSLAFDPTGSTLAAGGQDGSVTLWDVATRTALGPALSSQTGDVSALAFVNHGSEIVAGASDGTVVTYNIDPGHLRAAACAIADRNLTRTEWAQYLPNYPYNATCGAQMARNAA